MPAKINVEKVPVVISEEKLLKPIWQFKEKLANQDLENARKAILKDLKDNVANGLSEDVNIVIGMDMKNFEIKIDLSQIQHKSDSKLIKSYLKRDIKKFWKTWESLA
jgi:hypothetical protein